MVEEAGQSTDRGPTLAREALAFAIAHGIRLAAGFTVGGSAAFQGIHKWAIAAGGGPLLQTVLLGISAGWMLVTLALFLVIRGAIGGTPALVAPVRGRRAITTRGAEVGAYVVAGAAHILAIYVANYLFLIRMYVSLNQQGLLERGRMFGMGLNAVFAIGMFAAFFLLRRTLAQPAARIPIPAPPADAQQNVRSDGEDRIVRNCTYAGAAMMVVLNLLFGFEAGFPGGALGGAIGGAIGMVVGVVINRMRRPGPPAGLS